MDKLFYHREGSDGDIAYGREVGQHLFCHWRDILEAQSSWREGSTVGLIMTPLRMAMS